MVIRTILSLCLVGGMLLAATGCTTVLGTSIATDSVVPSIAGIQLLGRVRGSVSASQWFWAREADKQIDDEAKRAALKQKGGDLLINAKITTTLTSYLGVYYKTEVAIEGMAAKQTGSPLEAQPSALDRPVPKLPLSER
ncbi:MAG: hypothetical protein EPO64_05590 [Nitrospirae bacterium]|nr:MAG: hypothetical protein EPO64_05590 [Nitrospirota bacterium]